MAIFNHDAKQSANYQNSFYVYLKGKTVICQLGLLAKWTWNEGDASNHFVIVWIVVNIWDMKPNYLN